MGIYSRCTALSAAVGILALAAAPGLWAQQPGQNRSDTGAVQADTSGYKGYQPSDTTKVGPNDTSGMNQGAPSDTALKAEPGVQTGPSAEDSGAANRAGMTAPVDSVVCKDGSRAAKPGKANCAEHGGVDKAATKAAWKARGYESYKPGNNNNNASDTTKPSGGADSTKANNETGYQYHGPATDSALKAKPGVQTGPSRDSSHADMSDSSHTGVSDTSHAGMSDTSHAGMSDSTSTETQR